MTVEAKPNWVAIFYTGASTEFYAPSYQEAKDRIIADYPKTPFNLLKYRETVFAWRFLYFVAKEFSIELTDDNMDRICRLAQIVKSVITDLREYQAAVG